MKYYDKPALSYISNICSRKSNRERDFLKIFSVDLCRHR